MPQRDASYPAMPFLAEGGCRASNAESLRSSRARRISAVKGLVQMALVGEAGGMRRVGDARAAGDEVARVFDGVPQHRAA